MSKAKRILEKLQATDSGDWSAVDLALSGLRRLVMGIETPFILTSYDRQAFELARKAIADELFGTKG